jgi:hypothetical protein
VCAVYAVLHVQEPRTLSAAVGFYCGRLHSKTDAHSALGDAWATLKVLIEQAGWGHGLRVWALGFGHWGFEES